MTIFLPPSKKVMPVGSRTHDSEPVNASNLKPYRTKAMKQEARETARRVRGAWHSPAPVIVRKDDMRPL